MAIELLATCWTHAGDAMPIAGRHLNPWDLRVRARAVVAAGFTGIGFTIDDLEAAKATYGLPQVKRICEDLGWSISRLSCSRTGGPPTSSSGIG